MSEQDGRENILNAAVRFLQNPIVQKTSSLNQETFLRGKGLTDEEIQLVIQRAQSAENQMVPPNQLTMPLPPPIPSRYDTVNHSSRSGVREFINTTILICGFTYGVYQFYKKYIHDFLFGEQNEIEKKGMRDDDVAYSQTIDELCRSVEIINETLKSLQEQQQQSQFSEVLATAKQIDDLKAEVASVKSLLLGRNQFASPLLQTLRVPPSIPAWQLLPEDEASEAEAETVQECKDDTEVEAGSHRSSSSDEHDAIGRNNNLNMVLKNAY